MLEYAALIWNPSSQSSKIDSVQHRASKIIILAVSSTNNNKTEQKNLRKTVAVFLDLSAAFDRVWRQKLIHIIHSTGIKGNALLWINDLLRARKFSVRFKGARLKSYRLWAGVPLGLSSLSSIVFYRYYSFSEGHKRHFEEHCYLGKDLKLSINADKTTFCVFSTDRKHRGTFNLDIKINDSPIKRIDFPTNLSITLDPKLRFTRHIVHTANKALKS
ncbi:hypothetical protein CEXT_647301 [Caerostris extrusa]|uniref:Reverse transcriptase domain-containing protein n=1 Tax=Caerostris extrusa TaxID=172846 RepID=A0AAV4NWA4_CAEEX|nr:hypothetical protein CEXT_647301 [Caerostris extrusa]